MQKHSKQSKVSIKSILCVSILIIGITTFSTMRANSTTDSYNQQSYSLLTPHNPISITSDSDFEVFPGSGTVEDPYIIDGYNITTSNECGISITDTTKYFIVRNCYVDAVEYGIYIDDVADGTATVINNTCNNNYRGIWLWFSSYSTVANNTCSNNSYGICLYYSGSSTVTNNTFTNCGLYISEHTIDAYLSDTVENNWVNGKKLGFYTNLDSTIIAEPVYGQLIFINCTNVTVRDQILNSATTGLFLYSCRYSNIINNTFSNNTYCGIFLDSSVSSTVENNMCSNNYIGILIYYSGSSTVINNTNTNEIVGIYFFGSSGSTLTHNTFYNCGLYVTESSVEDYLSYIIEDNLVNDKQLGFYINLNKITFTEPIYGQLILINCTETVVCNQELSNTTAGLYLLLCEKSTITDNICNNNFYGIWLSYSPNNTIINNSCNNNKYGIYLVDSSEVALTNNTCNNNNDIGIWLINSDSCVISLNLLKENGEYGIRLHEHSDGNNIHHNAFVGNNLGETSQGYDDGTNNTWYDANANEGNYWSDWSGTGSYAIDGSASTVDLYPLSSIAVLDFIPPSITNVVHSPSSPTELDSININATVTDASGVQSVNLYYRVNGGVWQSIGMKFIENSIYSVTLGSFAVNDFIEYYIFVIDNSINNNEATEDNNGQYYEIIVNASEVIETSTSTTTSDEPDNSDKDSEEQTFSIPFAPWFAILGLVSVASILTIIPKKRKN